MSDRERLSLLWKLLRDPQTYVAWTGKTLVIEAHLKLSDEEADLLREMLVEEDGEESVARWWGERER